MIIVTTVRYQGDALTVLRVKFYVVLYFVMDACLLLLCLFQFFSTKPRDWLGRTYLRNDIFCVEWYVKPLLSQSVQSADLKNYVRRIWVRGFGHFWSPRSSSRTANTLCTDRQTDGRTDGQVQTLYRSWCVREPRPRRVAPPVDCCPLCWHPYSVPLLVLQSIRISYSTLNMVASKIATRLVAVYLGTHGNIGSKRAFPTGVLDRWPNCLLIYWRTSCLLPTFDDI